MKTDINDKVDCDISVHNFCFKIYILNTTIYLSFCTLHCTLNLSDIFTFILFKKYGIQDFLKKFFFMRLLCLM